MESRAPHLKRGKGFAAGFKNIGFSFGYQENCWAKIELHGKGEIDRVILHHASAEVGQGTHTVMTQMAAEALGVPADRVQLRTSDSATQSNSGSVSASRMTFMAGNAIKGAAEQALGEIEPLLCLRQLLLEALDVAFHGLEAPEIAAAVEPGEAEHIARLAREIWRLHYPGIISTAQSATITPPSPPHTSTAPRSASRRPTAAARSASCQSC